MDYAFTRMSRYYFHQPAGIRRAGFRYEDIRNMHIEFEPGVIRLVIPPEDDELVSVDDAALLLTIISGQRVTPASLRQQAHIGRGPQLCRVGNHPAFKWGAVWDWHLSRQAERASRAMPSPQLVAA
jgi:hypothetical protein